jgi:hypothetical protein
MLKTLTLTALMGQLSTSSGAAIDYTKMGENWPDTDATCKGDFQSPIDLKSDFDKVDYANDNFFKHYENLDTITDLY